MKFSAEQRTRLFDAKFHHDRGKLLHAIIYYDANLTKFSTSGAPLPIP